MVDWTTISDAQVDPKSPVTSELMSALRDNPTAIAEGASGAPKIAESWRVLPNTNNPIIVTDVDLGEGVRVETCGYGQKNSNGQILFTVSISSDNGATFVSETTLKSATASTGGEGELGIVDPAGTFLFDRPTGAWVFLDKSGGSVNSGTFPSASNVTDIRFRFTASFGSLHTTRIAALAFITGGKAAT